MTDHPYQPGTTWAPKSGRGNPRTIVESRWPDARDGKGRPYVWWDEMMSGRMIECRRATVTQFERWAGGAGGMKIDEDAIRASAAELGRAGANQFDLHTRMAMARAAVTAYLAELSALPSAEPGRDRIAVVVNRDGHGIGWLLGDMDEAEIDWPFIERASLATGPFAHRIVYCDLGRPEQAKTVKGTVEEAAHD